MVPTTSEALIASYDPFSPEALENPYPYYAALRSLAPCCYLKKYDVYFISRYRDRNNKMVRGFRELPVRFQTA